MIVKKGSQILHSSKKEQKLGTPKIKGRIRHDEKYKNQYSQKI